MSKATRPTLITLALSAAAVLGYVTYRLTLDSPDSGTTADHGHEPALTASEAAPATQPSFPDALPEFSMVNLAGEPQSIRSWPGQPLLVNFWATWCGPCLNEIPMLKTFQEEHPWLTVVGVAIDTDQAVQAFAEEMDFNYPILIGRTEGVSLATQLNVELFAMPVTVFTDAEGRTLGAHFGELHPEHLENLVAVLEDLQAGRADLDEARARIAGLM